MDDGSHLPFENNKRYGVQNTGAHDVKVCQRAASRGEPALDSGDVLILGYKEYAWIDVEPGANYYAWSQSQDSYFSRRGSDEIMARGRPRHLRVFLEGYETSMENSPKTIEEAIPLIDSWSPPRRS